MAAKTQKVRKAGPRPGEGEEGGDRRPYQRPEITFHERLEAFAAICSPGKADPITCPQGPIAS